MGSSYGSFEVLNYEILESVGPREVKSMGFSKVVEDDKLEVAALGESLDL